MIRKTKIIITLVMTMLSLSNVRVSAVPISESSFPQATSTIVDEGYSPIWNYYGYGSKQVLFGESYRLDGNYTKNGLNYQRLRIERHFFDGGSDSGINDASRPPFDAAPYYFVSGFIGVRESENRIFVNKDEYLALLGDESYWSWEGDRKYIPYEETTNGELILYDFTKKVGDRFCHVDGHDDIIVEKEALIPISDGSQRKMQKLSNGYVIIEGIGCVNSPGMWFCYLNPTVSPCERGVLIEVLEENSNNSIIYNNEDFEKWTQGIKSVNTSSQSEELYDLQGRHLYSTPSVGFYIKNRRICVAE